MSIKLRGITQLMQKQKNFGFYLYWINPTYVVFNYYSKSSH
nr:MAG TPA: hypothetical protein [Crassvirales sp.]